MKKQWKRLIAMVTATTLIFCFSSCGKKDEAEPAAVKSAEYTLELPIFALTEEKTDGATVQYSDFIFDKYGKLLGKKAEGDKTGVYDYIYNEKGLLDKETFTNDEGYFSETYFYNDDGTIESKRINSDYSNMNWVTYRYSYQLDEQNRPIRETRQFFKYGVGPTPDKTCIIDYTYDEYGNLIKSLSKDKETGEEQTCTYTYECIEHRTIYSKTEDHLSPTDTWEYYEEAPALPQPDSCSKKIPFSQKNNTPDGIAYTYRILANKDKHTQFEGAERYLLEYKTILTQLCDLTLQTQADDSVQILKDDTVLATLTTGADKQNNPLCILTFSEQSEAPEE